MISKNILNFSCSLFFALFFVNPVQAESLRWAADTESGAPYVFYDAKSLAMTGYEYDLVQAIAKKINRDPVFVQNAWDGLILGLNNNLYDIAINGIEITDDRKKSVFFSEPYYATFVNIITKQGDHRFKKLSDLAGFKIGTLGGALSERILRAEDGIQVLTYESEALAHQDLLLGRADALFLDAPIATYYSSVDPRFQVVPTVIGSMSYGIAISKKNPDLLKKINQALGQLIDSGELKNIYEKWGLWNQSTASLFGDSTPNRLQPIEFEKYKSHLNTDRNWKDRLEIYQKTSTLFLSGAWQTIKISFFSMIVAIFLGVALVTLRLYGAKPFRVLTIAFIELIRGTPLLLQLFFIFYALPGLGVEIPAFWAAVIALGVNYSVQESEIYRAGLNNIHKNQIEAAHMLGLTRAQTFWSIQVPQAIKFCLGPMTTDFIALIKDSSLVSVITLVELTKTYSLLSSTYYEYIGFAFVTAVLYMLIGMPLVILSRHLERGLTKQA